MCPAWVPVLVSITVTLVWVFWLGPAGVLVMTTAWVPSASSATEFTVVLVVPPRLIGRWSWVPVLVSTSAAVKPVLVCRMISAAVPSALNTGDPTTTPPRVPCPRTVPSETGATGTVMVSLAECTPLEAVTVKVSVGAVVAPRRWRRVGV